MVPGNFYITGDLIVELGLMCTDEKDNEELTKCTVPCAGKGTTKIQAASKKTCGPGF